MYDISSSKKYRRDFKRLAKSGKYNMSLLDEVIDLLAAGNPLPDKYKDHALKGKWRGFRDCHIQDDWVLIYKLEHKHLVLVLTRTGTHTQVLDF